MVVCELDTVLENSAMIGWLGLIVKIIQIHHFTGIRSDCLRNNRFNLQNIAIAVSVSPIKRPNQIPFAPTPITNVSQYPSGSPITQYEMKIKREGIRTSCNPRSAPLQITW